MIQWLDADSVHLFVTPAHLTLHTLHATVCQTNGGVSHMTTLARLQLTAYLLIKHVTTAPGPFILKYALVFYSTKTWRSSQIQRTQLRTRLAAAALGGGSRARMSSKTPSGHQLQLLQALL